MSQNVHTEEATTTAADGTVLAYQTRGTGHPLVLLAGQANSHHWWDAVRDDFHSRRRTITVDYRGTGASGKPEALEGYSTWQFADDVIAVLDALGIERADLYGTSMGGRVAQWVAARHPERIRRLVLGCTSPGGPHAVERDAQVRHALTRTEPGAAEEALTDLMYTPAFRAAHPGPYGTLGDPGMPPHARRGHLRASSGHDAWDALAHIMAPTLVLHGDQDRLTPPDNVPLLASRIPDVTTRLFPGARHAYFEECRTEAGTMVLDFLSGAPL
ncbi:alpha/beta fold hydrolase [Streptomyces endophyticus]|uniref:Alpha/beta hydrolase n=1 Tax=Streptomyces endophyticus TaxID=714166 RepID=A0ABU6F4A5_9ACTN|nr:alpha/beta fold hydrolase [Streptomyces endophyticus]MEB8338308.1 alpha/beta hydrolase [Streptomyces endophyticus]